jgi:multidrug efflux pump subunit AcrA (membrane-fusion protein)
MAALLASCGPAKAPPMEPVIAVVETAVVAPAAEGGLILSGNLARRREMTLSFRIAGVITDLAVDAGDTVAAGQSLARIDPTGVEARRTQVEADLERVRRDLRRDETLFSQGYVSQQRIDDRRSALKSAQAAYDSAVFDRRWASLSAPAGGVVLERMAQTGGAARVEPAAVLSVPAEAILEAQGDQAFVFRLQGDRVRRVAVRFHGFDGDFARVSGLAPTDRVVTAGAGFVSDGERVRTADTAAMAGAVR